MTDSPPVKTERHIYHVGTLSYTLPRLLLVGFIMLLSKQALSLICYNLIPQLNPVLLDKAGATPSQIAIIIGSIPSVITAILCPVISTVSDRTRTRIGRRIPYLLWSAPVLAALLVLIGFSMEIADGISRFLPGLTINFRLWVLGVLICLFQIVYLFPGAVVYYLDADVIPKECFGRYMALSSIASQITSASFSYFILKYAFSHTHLVLGLLAVSYLVVYLLQFFLVKEGEYPPTEEEVSAKTNPVIRAKDYLLMFFRQCFTRKIFIFLTLCSGLNAASNVCRGMFNMLFATKDLGLSFALVGKITAIGSLISAVLVFGFGKLMDKTHPMLIYFIGGILVMLVNVFGYFFVFAKPITYAGSLPIEFLGLHYTFTYSWTYAQLSYGIVAVVTTLMYAFQNLASTPLLVSIFPMEKFGQYASSNSMVINVTQIVAAAIGGIVTQQFGFRVMFVWDFIITGFATLALLVVYSEWKHYGGKNYKAPVVK